MPGCLITYASGSLPGISCCGISSSEWWNNAFKSKLMMTTGLYRPNLSTRNPAENQNGYHYEAEHGVCVCMWMCDTMGLTRSLPTPKGIENIPPLTNNLLSDPWHKQVAGIKFRKCLKYRPALTTRICLIKINFNTNLRDIKYYLKTHFYEIMFKYFINQVNFQIYLLFIFFLCMRNYSYIFIVRPGYFSFTILSSN